MPLNRKPDCNSRIVSGTTKEEAVLLLLHFMMFLCLRQVKIPPIFSRGSFSLRTFLMFLLSNGELKKKKLRGQLMLQRFQCFTKVWNPNLVVNCSYPHLGASPDGLVSCDCCFGKGTVEIKCPFSGRECNPAELHKLKNSFLNKYGLLRSHKYFTQYKGSLQSTASNIATL